MFIKLPAVQFFNRPDEITVQVEGIALVEIIVKNNGKPAYLVAPVVFAAVQPEEEAAVCIFRQKKLFGKDLRPVILPVADHAGFNHIETGKEQQDGNKTVKLYFDARTWDFNKDCSRNVGERSFMLGPDGELAEAYMIGNWQNDWTEILSEKLLLCCKLCGTVPVVWREAVGKYKVGALRPLALVRIRRIFKMLVSCGILCCHHRHIDTLNEAAESIQDTLEEISDQIEDLRSTLSDD